MSAQMKAFFDTTGGLWAKGALVNKFVSYTFTYWGCCFPYVLFG